MVEALLARYGYLAVFVVLAGAGVGLPLPEEPTQLASGLLVERGTFSFPLALVVCWLGIVLGDLAWFHVARRIGPRILDRRAVRKVLTPERRAKIEGHLARHGFLTVMVSRHLSGFRLPAFALAATHGVSWRRFVLADGLSALVSVPLVVAAGYFGARHLSSVHAELRRVELAVLLAVAIVIAVVVVVRRLRRGRVVPLPAASSDD